MLDGQYYVFVELFCRGGGGTVQFENILSWRQYIFYNHYTNTLSSLVHGQSCTKQPTLGMEFLFEERCCSAPPR